MKLEIKDKGNGFIIIKEAVATWIPTSSVVIKQLEQQFSCSFCFLFIPSSPFSFSCGCNIQMTFGFSHCLNRWKWVFLISWSLGRFVAANLFYSTSYLISEWFWELYHQVNLFSIWYKSCFLFIIWTARRFFFLCVCCFCRMIFLQQLKDWHLKGGDRTEDYHRDIVDSAHVQRDTVLPGVNPLEGLWAFEPCTPIWHSWSSSDG